MPLGWVGEIPIWLVLALLVSAYIIMFSPVSDRFRAALLGVLVWMLLFSHLAHLLPTKGLKHKKTPESSMKLRLYTHNIRYDNRHPVKGERLWEERQPLVSESIRFNTQPGAAVVCLQEVLHNQLVDIVDFLNQESKNTTGHGDWAYYGVGRNDGNQSGEYAPILFRQSDWHVVSNNTYWLSPTPDKPSKGWDAALSRIVTTVVLRSKASGEKVKVLNTHFDHKGVEACRELSKLIMKKMSGSEPAFLCGDFNTQPTDEPYKLLLKSGFRDSRVQGRTYGYNLTFSDFTRKHEANTIIDYIWAGKGPVWQTYGVVPNYFDFYMSDHRPVIADYLI